MGAPIPAVARWMAGPVSGFGHAGAGGACPAKAQRAVHVLRSPFDALDSALCSNMPWVWTRGAARPGGSAGCRLWGSSMAGPKFEMPHTRPNTVAQGSDSRGPPFTQLHFALRSRCLESRPGSCRDLQSRLRAFAGPEKRNVVRIRALSSTFRRDSG